MNDLTMQEILDQIYSLPKYPGYCDSDPKNNYHLFEPGDGTRYPLTIHQVPPQENYCEDGRLVTIWWDTPLSLVIFASDSPASIRTRIPPGRRKNDYNATMLYVIKEHLDEIGNW